MIDIQKEIETKEAELKTLQEGHDKMVEAQQQATAQFNQACTRNQAKFHELTGAIAALKKVAEPSAESETDSPPA
jgi:hypothetical protein